MGGAVTTALFDQLVLPSFGNGMIKRFTTFNLSEQMEQDDTCPGGDTPVYRKSLLYLVAKGLEPDPDRISRMVPLVGLELGLDARTSSGSSLRQAIESPADACDGRIVIAPGGSSPDLRSDARGHGDFDEDHDGPESSEDLPTRPWLPPDDRLWRHPSELRSAGTPPSGMPRVPPREPHPAGSRLWVRVVLGGVVGAVIATGVVTGGNWLGPAIVHGCMPAHCGSIASMCIGAVGTQAPGPLPGT